MAPSDTGNCTVCGTLTTTRCSKCTEGLDFDGKALPPTFYCRRVCQVAEYDKHKVSCRDSNIRKQLYRAADILQLIYLTCRPAAFDIDVAKIEEDGGKLHSGTIMGPNGEVRMKRCGFPIFDFPSHLIKQNDHDRAAVLTAGTGDEPNVYMDGLIEKVFKGICEPTNLKDCICRVPVDQLRVSSKLQDRMIDVHAGEFRHAIMIVEHPNRETYTLDLTGAQCGQYEALLPISRTIKQRTSGKVVSSGYGILYEKHRMLVLQDIIHGAQDIYLPHLALKRWTFEIAARVVTSWEEWNGITIAEVLKMKDSEYQAKVKEILKEVRDGLIEYVKCWVSPEGPQLEVEKESGRMTFRHGVYHYHHEEGFSVYREEAGSLSMSLVRLPKHRAERQSG